MRLILKNFRQHEHLDIELPNRGMIKLSGKSGVGKTTVLDAIYEAWFGDAEDVTPRGTSLSTSTELWMDRPAVYIKRTRGPKTLLVEVAGVQYKDEAAQKVLNDLIGMDSHAFLASSYARQGLEGSLLSLGAADQLRFVQALSSTKDPEKLRQAIRDLINRRTLKLAEASRAASDAADRCQAAHEAARAAAAQPPQSDQTMEELDALFRESEEVRKALEEKGAAYFTAAKLLQHPGYATLRGLEQLRAEIASQIADYDSQLAAARAQMAKLNNFDDKTPTERRKVLQSKRVRLETIAKMNALASDVMATTKADPTLRPTDALKVFEEMTLREHKAVGDRNDELLKILQDLKLMTVAQACPSCSVPLIVVSGKIQAPDGKSSSEAEIKAKAAEINQELATLGHKRQETTNKLLWISQIRTKIDTLKASLPADAAPELKTLDEIEVEDAKAKAEIENAVMARALFSSAQERAKNLVERTEAAKARLWIAEQDAEAAKALEPEETLKARVQALDAEASLLKERLLSYNPARDKRAKLIAEFQRYEKVAAIHKERVEVAEKLQIDMERKHIEERQAVEALAAAKRLQERSDEAAVMAIEITLEEINQNAKVMIDKMFAEDGTVIRIKNTSETAKGEAKAKFSTEIHHKGKPVNKLRSMSGGERSRAHMAFQLGLAEMYKSPILMVDEGFTGLPEEQLKECLEALREAGGDRLIMVIEHGAPESLFDQIFPFGDEELTESAQEI